MVFSYYQHFQKLIVLVTSLWGETLYGYHINVISLLGAIGGCLGDKLK